MEELKTTAETLETLKKGVKEITRKGKKLYVTLYNNSTDELLMRNHLDNFNINVSKNSLHISTKDTLINKIVNVNFDNITKCKYNKSERSIDIEIIYKGKISYYITAII